MIVGAGLAGLITAHAFPQERVIELKPEPISGHKALLRFRNHSVGDLTGVEFKPVTVRKGIFEDGQFVSPNIRLANLYSLKVIGRCMERSIWNLEPVTRYIAPSNYYDILLDAVGRRIEWGVDWKISQIDLPSSEPIISTAPLDATLDALGINIGEEFRRAPITVQRFIIPECDIYQTVYFPTEHHKLYRASITGNILICEFSGEPDDNRHTTDLLTAFGLKDQLDACKVVCGIVKETEKVEQRFGKIAPIDEQKRRAAIAKLSAYHNIFSIGRFATWRNILLDDVVHDIAVVKRLISASAYDRKLNAVGGSR